jgi:hypothetical protein
VIDARFVHRGEDGKLVEVDLNPLLGDRPSRRTRSRICWAPTAAGTAARRRRRRSTGRPASPWKTSAT